MAKVLPVKENPLNAKGKNILLPDFMIRGVKKEPANVAPPLVNTI